jgi:hypothetical protein
MRDALWEIALTIGIGVGVAAFFAYHKGAKTPPVTSSLADEIAKEQAATQTYNPATDFANSFQPSSFNYNVSYPLTVNNTTAVYNIEAEPLVPLVSHPIIENFTFPVVTNVINVSGGTPTCGCNTGLIQSANDAALAQAKAYNDTLSALESLVSPQLTPTISVNLTSPVKKAFQTLVNGIGNFVQVGGGETIGPRGEIYGGTG